MYNHVVKYKGIVHNVLADAPFIGAIVVANNCKMPCLDCINDHLKSDAYMQHHTVKQIVNQIKHNGLNEGVILSGLEWTEQPDELVELVHCSLKNQLEVMIYTHCEEASFFSIVPQLKQLPIYVKFGLYDPALQDDNYYSHSVKLATTNQYIKYFG